METSFILSIIILALLTVIYVLEMQKAKKGLKAYNRMIARQKAKQRALDMRQADRLVMEMLTELNVRIKL